MMRRLAALVALAAALLLSMASSARSSVARAAEPEAWYPVESPTTLDLLAIAFAPDGTGWVTGADGTVLRRDGDAFRPVPGPGEPVTLRFLAPLGPDEIWAAPPGGSQLYHLAGGRWSVVQLDTRFDVQHIAFLHPRLGYAAGLFGMLYRYDGERWERVRAPALVDDRESHLNKVAIFAEDDVWVGGQWGFLLHFDGKEWQRVPARRPGGGEGEGGRLQRLGDTIALLDAPALVRRGDEWHTLAPRSFRALAARGGAIWGAAFEDGRLLRLAAGEVEPARPERKVEELAEGPDGLWAVGEGGLILRLEPRWLPTFTDRTFEAGVGVMADCSSAALVDLDQRGAPDLLLAAPFGPNSFLRADDEGGYRVQPLAAPSLAAPPLAALPLAAALAAADVDGDGRADLVVRPPGAPGVPPLHLLRNLGAWRFLDAGPSAPPLPAEDASTWGAVEVGDLDGDGDLDVYEARYLQVQSGRQVPNVLWRNDGLGRLEAQALAHRDGGASLAWSAGALLADLTGDGRTDVLALNCWADGNTFFRQTEDGALRDDTAGSGLQGAYQCTGTAAAGDVDGDGALDVLMLADPTYGPARLFRNDGRGHFRDITSASGLDRVFASARRAEFSDMDLDGDLDLVLAYSLPRNPVGTWGPAPIVRLLLNDGRGAFTDVTARTGVGLPAHDILVEDLDGDGDQDVYLLRGRESNRLLANETPSGGWLKVRPLAPPPNRAALGARVAVYGPGGALLGVRETSWRHPVAHFGLGDAERVTVEVRFPSGRVARREQVERGQVLVVGELWRPLRWLCEAAFFARHRHAWADKGREGVKLLIAILLVLALARLGPRLGARRWAPRRLAAGGLLGVYGALAAACMPLVPLSRGADALPLAAVGALGLALLAADRASTRRREARFVGPYEILGVLGQGGMGTVYRARDTTRPGRAVVALKVLRPERVGDPASLRRFVREAELGARLSHPGIVAVLESGECRVREGRAFRTTAYLAMERVEGSSLASLLEGGERLPLARAVEIVRDAADALAAAHAAGVLHRDIKPDNLLLSRAGVVKLVDFGIAAVARAPLRSEAGLLVGTLAYLPPERVAGRAEDARGDLYALGAVLYEAVCGRRPFDDAGGTAPLLAAITSAAPPAPCALRPEVPPRLSALILALLAKDPADRPSCARQLVEALNAALRDLSGEPAPERPLEAAAAPAAEQVTLEVPAPLEPEVAPAPPRAAPIERETLDMPRSASSGVNR